MTLGTDEPVKKEAKETVKSAAVPEPFEQKRREQIYKAPAQISGSRKSAFTPLEENFFLRNSQRKNQELDEAKSRQAAVPPSSRKRTGKKAGNKVRNEIRKKKQPELRRSEPGTVRVKTVGNNTVRSKKKESRKRQNKSK